MKGYLILFLVAVLLSCHSNQEKQTDLATTPVNEDKIKSRQLSLSTQFDNALKSFIDKHDQLPVERLYVANFQHINEAVHVFFSSDINVPEVIEGIEQVRGVIKKDGFRLIIIDKVDSDGYGLYNPELLEKVNINFNDDHYSAPYRSEYKINSDTLILINS